MGELGIEATGSLLKLINLKMYVMGFEIIMAVAMTVWCIVLTYKLLKGDL